jgi:hypothetical protein
MPRRPGYSTSTLAVLTAAAVLLAEPGAAEASDGRLSIHVLIVGPGEALTARFGHVALVLDDHRSGQRRVYSWVTPEIDDPGMRSAHLRGLLAHRLVITPYRRVLDHYRREDRDATLLALDLSQARAGRIAALLGSASRPENRVQRYHHWTDNCGTRIRDLIDEVTDGALRSASAGRPAGRTPRQWTRRALAGMPLHALAIDYAIGPAGDRALTAWDEAFMPPALAAVLDRTRLPPDGRPLIRETGVVLVRQGPAVGSETPPARIAALAIPGALLALLVLLPLILRGRGPASRVLGAGLLAFGLTAGLGGLALALMWLATDHVEAHGNWNPLVTWPTHLWLAGPGLALLVTGRLGQRTARVLELYLAATLVAGLGAAALMATPWGQDNARFVAAFGATGLALLLGVRRHRSLAGSGGSC